MRATSVLRVLLALQQTRVLAFEFDDDGLIVDVAPSWRVPRCGNCRRKVRRRHDARERTWRHLDLAGIMLRLRFRIRRVRCDACCVVVEHVPWAEPGSGFTLPMENHVAYHAQRTDKTTVTDIMRIAWRTVGRIVRRYVRRRQQQAGDPLDGLRIIGVDELSYRRHHQYVTTVVDRTKSDSNWC
jgi:transposase